MNEGLEIFEDDEKVISIHGYIYNIKELPEIFFIRGADCWGWATWKRGWDLFEKDGKKLLYELEKRKLTKLFDFNGAYPYTEMLRDQIAGKNNSWAIRWYASAFLLEKLTLYPGTSLVKNIGIDGSGTNFKSEITWMDVELSTKPITIKKIPAVENQEARKKMENFFFEVIRKQTPSPPKEFEKSKGERHQYMEVMKISWVGDYKSWEEAKSLSTGYSLKIILEKVKEASLKVKKGEAVYERDGVTFDEIQYSWPLLAGLMFFAAQNCGRLSVVDFGGNLGTTFFQNRKFLNFLQNVSWNIIERPQFVKEGKLHFQNENLKFYEDIKICVEKETPNILILSNVLEYIAKPYELLENLLSYNFPFVLIDRTPFHDNKYDRITIQNVHLGTYKTSFPCWIFDKEKFISFFQMKGYYLIEAFDAVDGSYEDIKWKGFIFIKSNIK
jgi:putative methyltransferase (TIGR04325 family)